MADQADGTAHQVGPIGWIGREGFDDLRSKLSGWFDGNPQLTTGEFKDLSGLTRRAAIPWLEWLDHHKWTRRSGDHRIRGPEL